MVSAFEGSPINRELTEYECVKRICTERGDVDDMMNALDGRMYD